MSRILVVCDEGSNRSVTVAHHLKYLGHDCIPVGLNRNSAETFGMLCRWADHIIVTEKRHVERLMNMPEVQARPQMHVWDIGPDRFPRPFNPILLKVVRKLVEEHRHELAEPLQAGV